MGDPEYAILRIEDPTLVEVSVFLPAAYYAAIISGQTQMKVNVSGIDLGLQTISYKSPTIDSKLRTFEVKCILKNPPDGVAPGAMARIVVVLESREGLGVPSVATEQRSGRSVVFIVKDNVAHQVPVETGIESGGWTEILETNLAEEDSIITMGQYMVEEGTKVTVQKEDK
jgi:multidrug efflux pump subunit AcrA (membrane-fusion protein)